MRYEYLSAKIHDLLTRKPAEKRWIFWYFLLPRDAEIKTVSDTDYVVESIYFGDSGEHLQFAHGPIYGGYEAPAEWLVGGARVH